VIIDCQALPALNKLLYSNNERIVVSSVFAVSNIAVGSFNQIQEIINLEMFPTLVNFLRSDSARIRAEATWAVTNAIICGSSEQVKYIVSLGCIKLLCDLLMMGTETVQVCANGLLHLVKVGEHYSPNRYAEIIEEFYGDF
jgi:importin subunit alpha-6/7